MLTLQNTHCHPPCHLLLHRNHHRRRHRYLRIRSAEADHPSTPSVVQTYVRLVACPCQRWTRYVRRCLMCYSALLALSVAAILSEASVLQILKHAQEAINKASYKNSR